VRKCVNAVYGLGFRVLETMREKDGMKRGKKGKVSPTRRGETEGGKHTCVVRQADRPGHSRHEYPRKYYPLDAVEGEELWGEFGFRV
jgi:hypothetical protein